MLLGEWGRTWTARRLYGASGWGTYPSTRDYPWRAEPGTAVPYTGDGGDWSRSAILGSTRNA